MSSDHLSPRTSDWSRTAHSLRGVPAAVRDSPPRVEAAALGGHPVAFMVDGPWRKPCRMTEASDASDTAIVTVLLAMTFGILGGAAVPRATEPAQRAGRPPRCDASGRLHGRGPDGRVVLQGASRGIDRRPCDVPAGRVHVGVLRSAHVDDLCGARALRAEALAPSARVVDQPSRRTVADPVVGRDVLLGAALGVGWVLMVQLVDSWSGENELMAHPAPLRC